MRYRLYPLALVLLLMLFAVPAYAQDATEEATPIPPANTFGYGDVAQGEINGLSPTVSFNFSGATADFVTAEVFALTGELSPRISVVNAEGQQIATADGDQNGTASVTTQLPADGDYTLLVETTDASVGGFVLRLIGTSATTTSLEPGTVQTVNVAADQPVQGFLFTAAPDTALRVVANVPNLGVTVEVRDETGATFVSLRGAALQDALITPAQGSGVFTVLVIPDEENAGTGSISLELTSGAAAPAPAADAATPADTTDEAATETAGADDAAAATDEAAAPDDATPIPAGTAEAEPDEAASTETVGAAADGDATVGNAAGARPTNVCTLTAPAAGANVRSGPNIANPVIDSVLPGGYRVVIAASGDWVQVQGNGWVNRTVVELVGPCDALPASAAPVAPAAGTPGATGITPIAPQPTAQPIAPIGQPGT